MAHAWLPHSTPRELSTRDDIRWGIQRGLTLAVGYLIWCAAIYLLGGTRAFERVGVSFVEVAIFYVLTGVVAGAAIGLLRPLARWTVGAYATGLVAATIIAGGALLLLRGLPTAWNAQDVLTFLTAVVIATPFVGREMRRAHLAE